MRQELTQRPWRNTVYLLAQLPFRDSPDPPAQGGTAHSELGRSFPINKQSKKNHKKINKKTDPTDRPAGQSDEGYFSTVIPSSRFVWDCVEFIKLNYDRRKRSIPKPGTHRCSEHRSYFHSVLFCF